MLSIEKKTSLDLAAVHEGYYFPLDCFYKFSYRRQIILVMWQLVITWLSENISMYLDDELSEKNDARNNINTILILDWKL